MRVSENPGGCEGELEVPVKSPDVLSQRNHVTRQQQ